MTYMQIYKTLLTAEIEEYVPIGVSISHPVLDMREGRVLDCFVLYGTSDEGSKYTAPFARIVIDAVRKQLIEYKDIDEQQFRAYDGVDYFSSEDDEKSIKLVQVSEFEYQKLYMMIRGFVFRDNLTSTEKQLLIRYIKDFKVVEHKHLQPFLVELGYKFFNWVENVLG